MKGQNGIGLFICGNGWTDFQVFGIMASLWSVLMLITQSGSFQKEPSSAWKLNWSDRHLVEKCLTKLHKGYPSHTTLCLDHWKWVDPFPTGWSTGVKLVFIICVSKAHSKYHHIYCAAKPSNPEANNSSLLPVFNPSSFLFFEIDIDPWTVSFCRTLLCP